MLPRFVSLVELLEVEPVPDVELGLDEVDPEAVPLAFMLPELELLLEGLVADPEDVSLLVDVLALGSGLELLRVERLQAVVPKPSAKAINAAAPVMESFL